MFFFFFFSFHVAQAGRAANRFLARYLATTTTIETTTAMNSSSNETTETVANAADANDDIKNDVKATSTSFGLPLLGSRLPMMLYNVARALELVRRRIVNE